MRDINAGAFGQQRAEIFDLGGRTRHHFNRIAFQKGFDFGGDGFGVVRLFLETQQSHYGLP
jgi:hypothetical protein